PAGADAGRECVRAVVRIGVIGVLRESGSRSEKRNRYQQMADHWLAPFSPDLNPNRRGRKIGVTRPAEMTLLGDAPGITCAQSPSPGSGVKYLSYFPSSPLCSSASAGLSFLRVMLGHWVEKVACSSSHFSWPDSVSGKMASAGHSGSHTPQSIHSLGLMTRMFSPSWNTSTGQRSTH